MPPRHWHLAIAFAASLEVHESGKAQMHSHDRYLVGGNHVEHATTGIGSARRINIEDYASMRKRRLYFRNMHRISPNQKSFRARTEQTHCMTWSVTRRLQHGDSGKNLSIREEKQLITIRRKLLTRAFEKERAIIFAGALHYRVVHPVRIFVRADRQFSIREARPAFSSVGKSADVIRMDMGQENSIDSEIINTSRTQIGCEKSGVPPHVFAGARIDQHGAAGVLDNKRVDFDDSGKAVRGVK